MATTTTKKAGRPVTKAKVEIKETTVKKEVIETPVIEKIEVGVKPEVVKPKQKVKIPADTLISCRSGVRGELRYISKRMNGMQYIWNNFGDENEIELQELQSMRNTDLRFFKDNWLIIEDSEDYSAQEIYSAIAVSQYYTNTPSIDNFDSLFNETPEKIESIISGMSNGLKDTIAIRAKELYNSGVLDSRKRTEALERALNIELIIKGV